MAYDLGWNWLLSRKLNSLKFEEKYCRKDLTWGFDSKNWTPWLPGKITPRKRWVLHPCTLPTTEILSGKNARAWVSMVLYSKKSMKNEKKKIWEPFRSCLLNSTANSAQFGWKWTGLAVTPKPLLGVFTYFQDIFLNNFIKNPQTRNARAFLPYFSCR